MLVNVNCPDLTPWLQLEKCILEKCNDMSSLPAVEIIPIRAFKDNYIWLGINRDANAAFVIDPGDATPVLNILREMNLNLTTILITHKHNDHIGGVGDLLKQYPSASIYANPLSHVSSATHWVGEGDFVDLVDFSLRFNVLAVPGHTLDHVCYYDETNHLLFCGDTLFGSGCGRVFEGTFEEMYTSLNRLQRLPNDTLIYCAHEYTLSNLQFAKRIEPNNNSIQHRIFETEILLSQDKPSVPFLLSIEKETNPFLRCTEAVVVETVEQYSSKKLNTPLDVFAEMRQWKNTFSPAR